LEFITFFLAVTGYVGLTVANVLAWSKPASSSRRLVQATAAVVFTHVVLVWTVRYDWQLDQATRNGYAGFLIFHTALALILAAAFASPRRADQLVRVVFPIVTLGALGAVFGDAAVTRYRIAVIILAICGALGIATGVYRRVTRPAPAEAPAA
jgi:hypothetical protein